MIMKMYDSIKYIEDDFLHFFARSELHINEEIEDGCVRKVVINELLKENAFKRVLLYWSDDEIATFEACLKNEYKFTQIDVNTYDVITGSLYVNIDKNGIMIVPEEVKELYYRIIEDREFDIVRRRNSWVRMCLFYMGQFHTPFSLSVLYDLVALEKYNISIIDLEKIVDEVPSYIKEYLIINNNVFHAIIENMYDGTGPYICYIDNIDSKDIYDYWKSKDI